MGGDVFQYTETILSGYSIHIMRGGSWADQTYYMGKGGRIFSNQDSPPDEFSTVGFRVAYVPEPSTFALLGIAAVGLMAFARRRRG